MTYVPFRLRRLKLQDNGNVYLEFRIFRVTFKDGEDDDRQREEQMEDLYSGTLREEYMQLELPKEHILLISMGLIRQQLGRDKIKPSKLRQLLRDIATAGLSKDLEYDLRPKYDDRIFIDIFTTKGIYRIDTHSFDYSYLLSGEYTLSSEQNLRKLVRLLYENFPREIQMGLEEYLKGGKRKLPVYSNIYEFQESSQNTLNELYRSTADRAISIEELESEADSDNTDDIASQNFSVNQY